MAARAIRNRSCRYDGLNRLTSVNDSGGFWRNYGYDARGNRWVTGTGGIGTSGLTPVANIYNNANRINGAYYDGAGNMRSHGTQTLAYDAENRQTTVTESPSMGGGQAVYTYDGEGRRVMRTIGHSVTVFVYDVFGNLAAEYNNYATDPSPCATCYLSADHLGSTRMVTDAAANIIARHDYLPFGEEIRAGEAQRRSEWGITGDARQKFTGQLRDNETGLDFFNARYLSAEQGRFLSPDPENIGASLEDPQSWNAYSYLRNTPTIGTDPRGERPAWLAGVIDLFKGGFSSPGKSSAHTLCDGCIGAEGDPVFYTSHAEKKHRSFADQIFGDPSFQPNDQPLSDYARQVLSQTYQRASGPVALTGAGLIVMGIGLSGGVVAADVGTVEALPVFRQLAAMSNKNYRHIAQHLNAFKDVDQSITVEKIIAIGEDVVKTGMPTARAGAFTKHVTIGGRDVLVRAVLNSNNGLRSVHILSK